jgi:putative transcription antitermination factor YqgF
MNKTVKLPALGIDHGEKWLGLAASDQSGDFVWAIGDIQVEKSLERISEFIEERSVKCIVLGYPLMLDGSPGEQCRKVEMFKTTLGIFNLPVFFQDERLSNRSKLSHSAAAVEILERWLLGRR